MRVLIFLFLMPLLLSCENRLKSSEPQVKLESKDSIAKTVFPKDIVDTLPEEISDFKHFRQYKLTDTISADLTGDGVSDWAFLSVGRPKRLFVTDGRTRQTISVGTDKSFEGIADDLSWVDYWGLTRDDSTYKVIVRNSEIVGDTTVNLLNPSLVFRKLEVGGGVVTFDRGVFNWVHQAD